MRLFPPGSRTIMSGRCAPPSPTSVVCSKKSQCATIPDSSATRRRWISPQRPREIGPRSASFNPAVSSRSRSLERPIDSTCWRISASAAARAVWSAPSLSSKSLSLAAIGATWSKNVVRFESSAWRERWENVSARRCSVPWCACPSAWARASFSRRLAAPRDAASEAAKAPTKTPSASPIRSDMPSTREG